MTYKKIFLSILICSQLLIQPIQASKSLKTEEKQAQTSSWFTWKNLGLAASTLILGKTLYNWYRDTKAPVRKNEKKEVDFVAKNIDELVDTLSANQTKTYSQYNKTFIEYLSKKSQDESNFFENLNSNTSAKKISEVLQSSEYQNNQNEILTYQKLFKNFLTIFQNKDIVDCLKDIDDAFNIILEMYNRISLLNTNKIQGLDSRQKEFFETVEGHYSENDIKEIYMNIKLPLYARIFNLNKLLIYQKFVEKKPVTNTELINFDYDQNKKTFVQKKYMIFLNKMTELFIDTYLKYYEPTKTLEGIKKNINILSDAVSSEQRLHQRKIEKKYRIKNIDTTSSNTQRKPIEPARIELKRQENISPFTHGKISDEIRLLSPDMPPKLEFKRLLDYN